MDDIRIGARLVGPGRPCLVVAEMSANHNQSYDEAVKIIHAAKESGADAVKLQTYTPDTITLNCETEHFRIKGGLWSGKTLHELYRTAYTPWEWQPRLKEEADKIGLTLFSSPFDPTAVDFLDRMDVPAYKIASFELVDIPLIEYVAKKGKPIIMSTGMGTLGEIDEAVRAVKTTGNQQLILLKCVSAYPADPKDMNLRTIPNLCGTFGLLAGLSDHTLGHDVAVAAVSLGARVIEKHFTLSRKDGGPDSAFSMEPDEFRVMVDTIRMIEESLGCVHYEPTERETENRKFRRSLFVVRDVKAGDKLNSENVRSIRPGDGLHPRYLCKIKGRTFRRDVSKGTPLGWNLI